MYTFIKYLQWLSESVWRVIIETHAIILLFLYNNVLFPR